MKPIVVRRGLQRKSNLELEQLWRELATLLEHKYKYEDGTWVPFWQEQYDALVNEFARRGVQLRLF